MVEKRHNSDTSLIAYAPTWLHFSLRFSRSRRKSPKSAAGRTNINNGMIMNQIVREKPISYWPTGANDWPAVYLHSASPLSLRSFSFSLFLFFPPFLYLSYSLFLPLQFPRSLRSFTTAYSLPRTAHAFFSPFFFPPRRVSSRRCFSPATRARSDNTHSAYFSINLNYKTSR